MPRIHPPLRLTDAEASVLRQRVRTGVWLARDLQRANILLLSHERPVHTQATIASRAGCSIAKVRRTCSRYRTDGLEAALHDLPRSGQPRSLTPEHEAFIVATACTEAPVGHDHWSLALLNQTLTNRYETVSVSDPTIAKVLLKNNLKPWLKKNVVHSETGRSVHRAYARRLGAV